MFGENLTFTIERLDANPNDLSFFHHRISILSYNHFDEKSYALATVLQGSVVMSPQGSPTIVDILITNKNILKNKKELEDLIQRLDARVVWTDGELLIVSCSTLNSTGLKFWIGFADVNEAETKRDELES